MRKAKRIGILGGTFNPPHTAHLVLGEQARITLKLDKVIFVPTFLPPHKRKRQLAPAAARLRMVALATKTNPYFEISDLELNRGGISYSVETVKKLNSKLSCTQLYFIVGSDFLKEFSTWKSIKKLSKICRFAIAQRPGYPYKKLPGWAQPIPVSALEISSTDIRKRIRKNKSIRYLVPEEVRRYILKKKLYC